MKLVPEKEYYESLPKKCVAAAAIFLNQNNEILIVKPSYRDYWLLPGGIVEGDESPMDACVREVMEEIGLEIRNPKFLAVDYRQAEPPRPEFIHFIFEGGILDQTEIDKIKFSDGELTEYKFAPLDEAAQMLSLPSGKRTLEAAQAIISHCGIYLENGGQIVK